MQESRKTIKMSCTQASHRSLNSSNSQFISLWIKNIAIFKASLLLYLSIFFFKVSLKTFLLCHLASKGVKFQFLWHAAFPKACSSGWTQNLGNHYSQTNFKWLWTWAILMTLPCENEKFPNAYSNDLCSICTLKKPKRMSLFNRQMDTIQKLVKTKCSSLPQLSWQHKKFQV